MNELEAVMAADEKIAALMYPPRPAVPTTLAERIDALVPEERPVVVMSDWCRTHHRESCQCDPD